MGEDQKEKSAGRISDRFPASQPANKTLSWSPKPLEVRDGQIQPTPSPEAPTAKGPVSLTTRFFGTERPFADYVLAYFQALVPSLPGSGGDGGALDRKQLRQSLAELMEGIDKERELLQNPDFASQLALIRQHPDDLLDLVIEGTLGLGPLEPLLKDPEVREIMANGPSDIFVEKQGRVERAATRFRDEQHMLDVIGRFLSPLGKRVDFACPMADARMPDGSRVNVIVPPLSVDGPAITIRKLSERSLAIEDLVRLGSMTQAMAEFLGACVKARLSLVISGGTGSGKTTLLNVLSNFIPDYERIILIEDTSEIRISKPNRLRLEARTANIEGAGEVTIRDLVRNALRMRPDRIVVGECRGGEALDMLQAMNTGHEGSMTTVHANSPRDLLSRLEVMVLMSGMSLPIPAIQRQIAGAVQLIVQVDRLEDGSRRVTRITEVDGFNDGVCSLSDLFEFRQEGYDERGFARGRFVSTGIRPRCLDKLARHGIEVPASLFQPS